MQKPQLENFPFEQKDEKGFEEAWETKNQQGNEINLALAGRNEFCEDLLR